jgi:RHS repeat-associated protein
MTTTGGTGYAVSDWLGSVTGLINTAGTQVTSTTYSAYGTPATTGTPVPSIGYAAAYTLTGTGLDDMRARDYNPADSAFTTVDPLLDVSGQPYAYADDAPVYGTDPSGTITCSGLFSWVPGCGVITDMQNNAAATFRNLWVQLSNGWCGSAAANGPLIIDGKQFGKKVGKHAEDFGLDKSNPADRQAVRDLINDIYENPDEIRQGPWNPNGGGGNDYFFYRKGRGCGRDEG